MFLFTNSSEFITRTIMDHRLSFNAVNIASQIAV